MKRNKSIIWKISLGFFTMSTMVSMPLVTTISKNSEPVIKEQTKKFAIASGSSSGLTESDLTFTINTNLSWKGKYFVDQVTNTMIEEMLIPDKQYGANFYVKLLPITQDMILNGYVEFVVKQIKYSYGNDASNTSGNINVVTETFINPPSNGNTNPSMTTQTPSTTTLDGETITQNNVWTTKNITGLFLTRKYNFKWNSDRKIGDFLKITDKKSLTSDDIMLNFVSNSDSTDILPIGTTANFNQFSLNVQQTTGNDSITHDDATKYGVGEIQMNFNETTRTQQNNNWASGQAPTTDQSKRIVRGLVGSDGQKHEVKLNLESGSQNLLSTTLDVSKIKKQNPNFNPSTNINSNQVQIRSLTPSELLNALNGNLKDLLTTTNYLATSSSFASSTPQLPPIYVEYMDKNAFTSDLPFKGSGLSTTKNVPYVTINNDTRLYEPIMSNGTYLTTGSNSVNNLMNITNIEATAIDSTGTLELIIKYDRYDIFYNVMVKGFMVPITISGFQTNSTFEKSLYFSWKDVENIPYQSANDLYNAYSQNQSNQDYLNALANSLFSGSLDTYNMQKEIVVNSPSSNSTEVTITFKNFGGDSYVDSSGTLHKGRKFTKTFTFSSSSSGAVFQTQTNVESEINNAFGKPISEVTPTEAIDAISKGKISENSFVVRGYSRSQNGVLFTPGSDNKTLIVSVVNSNGTTSSNFYTGFKEGQSSDYTYNFGFTNSSSDTLKGIPLEEITAQDVIDNYLNKLPLFSSTGSPFRLTPENITLTKNPENGSLTITLSLDGFVAGITETSSFTTTMYGFNSQTIIDGNSYVAPLNLTIPLSASFAALIAIIFTVLLVLMIRKRSKFKKIIKEDKYGHQHQ